MTEKMTRKVLLTLLAVLLTAITATADEVNDTTINYKDKQLVVEDDSAGLRVSVYKGSQRLTKVSETRYIDGREVERVFVGSPFIPKEELQDMAFLPHFPTLWMGFSRLSQKVGGNQAEDIHGRYSKGFEIGFTPFSVAQSFNKSNTFGVVAAMQVVYTRFCFQKDWQMASTHPIAFVQTAERAKGHYMDVGSLRLPVMLQISYDNSDGIAFGLAPEWRMANRYKWNPMGGSAMQEVSGSCEIKPFGLNLESYVSYGPLSLTGSVGLTPLFKTADGKKGYSVSANVGIDIWGLIRLLSKK